jgi:hypothetical protein
MRLTGLLALLLFVLIVFYAAPAASFGQTANTPAVKSDNHETDSMTLLPEKLQLARDRVSERPLVASQPLLEHNGDLVLRESLQDLQQSDDFDCLKLRTYIVARDDKTTDATHPVRKVDCTPARKFNFKTADIRIDDKSSQPASK